MAQVVVSPRAARQLEEIFTYSDENWGRKKAEEYLAGFEKRFLDLGNNKLLGRARPELGAGYRSLPQGQHVIFYSAGNDNVLILAVLHGNMDVHRRIAGAGEKGV